jgi:hypothetical protein
VNAAITVDAVIGWLNVALTSVLVATPVTAGVLAAGDVDKTVGRVPTLGAPRIGSMPPPQPARNRVTNATFQPSGDRRVSGRWFIAVCALLVLFDASDRVAGPDDRDGAGGAWGKKGKWHLRKRTENGASVDTATLDAGGVGVAVLSPMLL